MRIRIHRLALVIATAGMAAIAVACGSDSNGGGPGNTDAGGDGAVTPLPDSGSGNDATMNDANVPDTSVGHDTGPATDTGTGDAPSGDASDAGVDGPFMEAPHPRFPIVVNADNGPVIAAPELTSVTFNNTTYLNMVSDLDAFTSGIVSQPWWAATTSEYGVGAGTVRPAAHLAEAAPAVIYDSEIQAWIAAKFAANDPAFGTASANTLLVLYYPVTTTIYQGSPAPDAGPDAGIPNGMSCQAFGGYHGFAEVQQTSDAGAMVTSYVPYAVVPECGTPDAGASNLGDVTAATSHEILEACTDPYVNGEDPRAKLPDGGHKYPPTVVTAFAGTSTDQEMTFDPYLAWPAAIVGSLGGLELGDMCESFGSSRDTPTGFPYAIQRTWSNKAVRAGKDPCEPYKTGEATYFAAVPVFDPNFATNEAMNPPVYLPQIKIVTDPTTNPVSTFLTQGVEIAGPPDAGPDASADAGVGGSATIPVVLYSDGPTPPWTVSARDALAGFTHANPNLTFAWDKTTGQNGDILHLTITVTAVDPNFGGNVFVITSYDGVLRHSFYGFVGSTP